jgi:hypothetical protein
MVTNDSPMWLSDRRVGERRHLLLRRSGVDRRFESIPIPVDHRREGARRVLSDRRGWTERRHAEGYGRPD